MPQQNLYAMCAEQPHPRIKCHVSKRTGEKIYHLSSDIQYDTAIIDI